MVKFQLFLILVSISTVVDCSFTEGLLIEYEGPSWSKPWVHDVLLTRDNQSVVVWNKPSIKVFYAEFNGDGWIATSSFSREVQDFLKARIEDMLDIAKQLILQVRSHKNHRIYLPRRCRDDDYRTLHISKIKVTNCSNSTLEKCQKVAKCFDLPVDDDHADACFHDDEEDPVYKQGAGIAANILLYVGIKDCEELANACPCQLEPQYLRPVAGRIAVCAKTLQEFKSMPNQFVQVLLHELMHILLRPLSGYEYVGHKDRSYVKVNRNWHSPTGASDRIAFLSKLPTALELVRKHFDCPDLEGVELDNGTEVLKGNQRERELSIFVHVEGRLFPDALMSPLFLTGNTLSKLDVAFLNDTGWYVVNMSMGRELTVTRGKGCDFARMSCYEYMKSRNFDRVSMYPYCTHEDKKKWMCSLDNRDVGSCLTYERKKEVGQEFQINIGAKYVGSEYFEYCPMVSQKSLDEDISPRCAEFDNVRFKEVGAYGGQEDARCIRFEYFYVKKTCDCPAVEEKYLGVCVKVECIDEKIEMTFGGQKFSCVKGESGQRKKISFESVSPFLCSIQATICCPDFEVVCANGRNVTPIYRLDFCSCAALKANLLFILLIASIVLSYIYFN